MLIAPVAASAQGTPSILYAGQSISGYESYLESPDGQYDLNASDGDLSLIQDVSGTDGHDAVGEPWEVGDPGNSLTTLAAMQTDGNFVLYVGGRPIWASNTAGSGSNNYLAVQSDGNLVVYTQQGRAVWASASGPAAAAPTSILLPNGQLKAQYGAGKPVASLVMQTDGNLVLYSGGQAKWASATRSPGARLVLQDDGNLVIYTTSGRAIWASGTAGFGPATQLDVSAAYYPSIGLYSENGSWFRP